MSFRPLRPSGIPRLGGEVVAPASYRFLEGVLSLVRGEHALPRVAGTAALVPRVQVETLAPPAFCEECIGKESASRIILPVHFPSATI